YEAFGTTGIGIPPQQAADDRYLRAGDVAGNLLTLGFHVHDWERPVAGPWPGVGAFESALFELRSWWPRYAPIRRSQAADDYWAAKVLARFSPEQIRAAVEAGRLGTPAATEYLTRTLIQRRR